ncbi:MULTISPECIES: hypothetical protein [Streptomyces]|uniref:Uncharacterized protein n=1 Tax=Streptomyces viridochromogenes TaxID=1938 RepID=A0A0L8J3L4_STRVR|nr:MULTISPECIES: hypothetical protein [Streptomyces]KOG08231.1 hypothetical protein ADK34_39370 [Streptomyces viridochromogenes]
MRIGTGLKAVDYPALGSSGDLDGDGLSDLWGRKSNNSVVGLPGRTPAADGMALGAEFTIGRTLPTGTQGGTPGKADMMVHMTDGTISVRKNMGTYFDGGTPASAYWSNFLDGPEQGRLYFE